MSQKILDGIPQDIVTKASGNKASGNQKKPGDEKSKKKPEEKPEAMRSDKFVWTEKDLVLVREPGEGEPGGEEKPKDKAGNRNKPKKNK